MRKKSPVYYCEYDTVRVFRGALNQAPIRRLSDNSDDRSSSVVQPDWKNIHPLSGRLAFLGIMGYN